MGEPESIGDRQALDLGRLAVMVTATVLARIFDRPARELRDFVAKRHPTYLDNALANTYRSYAWVVLAGSFFVLSIAVSLPLRAAGVDDPLGLDSGWGVAVFGFLALCGLLSGGRSALAKRLLRSRLSAPPAERADPSHRPADPETIQVASRMTRFFVAPANIDAILCAAISIGYLTR